MHEQPYQQLIRVLYSFHGCLGQLTRHAYSSALSQSQFRVCLQDHFLKILPEAEVEAINAMYTEAAEEQLLGGKPDYILDAIDNIDTKVALLAACHRRGIPVLSSAGAGGGF